MQSSPVVGKQSNGKSTRHELGSSRFPEAEGPHANRVTAHLSRLTPFTDADIGITRSLTLWVCLIRKERRWL